MGKTSWNGVLGRAWVTRWPLSAIKQPSSEDPLFLQPLEGVIHPTIGIRALLTDPKSVATGLVDVERYVHAGVPALPRIYLELGRAWCRARVCQYVESWGVPVASQKQK